MRFLTIRYLQKLFFGIGLILLAYAGGTLAYAELFQRYQARQLENKTAPPAPPADLSGGDVMGKLDIPRLGISVVVLQGVEDDVLRIGAGHVPGTPSPGGDGNSVIAAHRDTFFRKLEGIRTGDRIQFTHARSVVEYVVGSTEVVEPEDTRAMESHGFPELTLISCFPFYFVGSAPHRFIVHATPAALLVFGRR